MSHSDAQLSKTTAENGLHAGLQVPTVYSELCTCMGYSNSVHKCNPLFDEVFLAGHHNKINPVNMKSFTQVHFLTKFWIASGVTYSSHFFCKENCTSGPLLWTNMFLDSKFSRRNKNLTQILPILVEMQNISYTKKHWERYYTVITLKILLCYTCWLLERSNLNSIPPTEIPQDHV